MALSHQVALWLCGEGSPVAEGSPSSGTQAGPAAELCFYLQPIGQPGACAELSAFPGLWQARREGRGRSGGLERRRLGPVQSHGYEVSLAAAVRKGWGLSPGTNGTLAQITPSVHKHIEKGTYAMVIWGARLGQREGTFLILQTVLPVKAWAGARDDPQSPADKRSQLSSGHPATWETGS